MGLKSPRFNKNNAIQRKEEARGDANASGANSAGDTLISKEDRNKNGCSLHDFIAFLIMSLAFD